jgi:hypothetical protein
VARKNRGSGKRRVSQTPKTPTQTKKYTLIKKKKKKKKKA